MHLLEEERKIVKTVIYCRDGTAFGDHDIIEKVDEFLQSDSCEIRVSVHLFVDALMALIHENTELINQVRIIVERLDGSFADKAFDGRYWDWWDSENVLEAILKRITGF